MSRGRLARLAVFAVWLGLVLFMVSRHAFWRDEGRALSLALQGENVIAMLRAVHGEGHPAVWYLLLRVAHALVGGPVALPLVGVTVAAASALLLLFGSPLPLALVTLILASGTFLYEFSVMARNYGISGLLLFVTAACYPRWRERGVVLGLLLALLANTNAHSVLLVGAFMLFWLLDLAFNRRLGWTRATWTRATGVWVANGCIAALGIVACALTIYPPFNDAAQLDRAAVGLQTIVVAVLIPGWSFRSLLTLPAMAAGWQVPDYPAAMPYWVMSALMFGSVLALARWPAALASGLVSLVGMSLFFALVYQDKYRHDGLWLAFLITLYWMAQARGRLGRGLVSRAGLGCFAAMMLFQTLLSARELAESGPGGVPLSQVRALAQALDRRPDLRDAILLPDPDYLLEAMPYYRDNPIFLPREQVFRPYARFSKQGVLDLSVGDLLAQARRLCRATGKPVVLVVQQEFDGRALPVQVPEGYNWHLTITPENVAALKSATEFLGRFEPAQEDETFGAYALHPPCGT